MSRTNISGTYQARQGENHFQRAFKLQEGRGNTPFHTSDRFIKLIITQWNKFKKRKQNTQQGLTLKHLLHIEWVLYTDVFQICL